MGKLAAPSPTIEAPARLARVGDASLTAGFWA